MSDLLALKNGQAYFLEVKREGGKPSADQLAFGKDVILAGAEFFIVQSIEDVQAIGL